MNDENNECGMCGKGNIGYRVYNNMIEYICTDCQYTWKTDEIS